MLPKHWNHFAHIKIIKISQDDSLEGSLGLYWRWPISGPKMVPLFSAEWLNQGNSLSDALKTVRRGGALICHDAIDMIGAAFWEAIIMKWVRRTKGLHEGVVWKLCTANHMVNDPFPYWNYHEMGCFSPFRHTHRRWTMQSSLASEGWFSPKENNACHQHLVPVKFTVLATPKQIETVKSY
jgi:hypothetical protein